MVLSTLRLKNQLLFSLPDAEWPCWQPLLEPVDLPAGKLLYERDADADTDLATWAAAAHDADFVLINPLHAAEQRNEAQRGLSHAEGRGFGGDHRPVGSGVDHEREGAALLQVDRHRHPQRCVEGGLQTCARGRRRRRLSLTTSVSIGFGLGPRTGQRRSNDAPPGGRKTQRSALGRRENGEVAEIVRNHTHEQLAKIFRAIADGDELRAETLTRNYLVAIAASSGSSSASASVKSPRMAKWFQT